MGAFDNSDVPFTCIPMASMKKLLAVIAQSVPFKPVMESLATVIGVSRNVLPDYFLYMEQAGMIGQLRDDTGHGG